MRILFVSTGLATGGAEKQLRALLGQLLEKGVEAGVVSLASPGPVSQEIAALGIPHWHLDLEGVWRLPLAAWRLAMIVRRFRPDVVQGWMYHGNLAALWTALAVGRVPVVWGVRQSLYDLQREKLFTRQVIRLCAWLSSRAAAIVYNAYLPRQQHESFGFAAERGTVIGNGFDGTHWRPDDAAYLSVRSELGLTPDTPLIGLIARYHPMKGHETFIQAAACLAGSRPDVHFLLAGRGVEASRQPFPDWIKAHPVLLSRVHLLGERHDIPRLTAALDIASSSSWGEAFSNAIAEALLCAVPVVATDVGDARAIIGDSGICVPVGDAEAMSEAWAKLLTMPGEARRQLGELGRLRLLARFGIEAIADRYLELYRGSRT